MDIRDSEHSVALENSMDLLMALLYAPGDSAIEGEPIEGMTRLQKLMFLLQNGVGPKDLIQETKAYLFEPYKMGPYANQLMTDLKELESARIVTSKQLNYWLTDDSDVSSKFESEFDEPARKTLRVESYRFSLSDNLGLKIGKDIWDNLTEKQREEFTAFKSFFNSLSLRQLLIYVYERFQKYTTESTIKHHLV